MKTNNDAENSALITGINDLLKYTQIETFFKIVIFHNIKICTAFLWKKKVNAGLVSIRNFCQKIKQIYNFN